jgi:ABC-2 type transport system ATP-binding protein
VLLRIQDVRVVFRRPAAPAAWLRGRLFGAPRTVLDGVNLHVARGEIVALLGANGAGKSTLLRVAAGLVAPRSGAVERAVRTGLGLAEERSFFWRLSVRENLRFFAALEGAPRDRIDALLDQVGLAGDGDLPVRACSTGMRARLALARALLGDPPLLLLDEMERGLDVGARELLRARLAAWASAERGALVVTHDLDEAAPYTRAVCLDAGRVVDAGPFADVARRLRERLAHA